MNMSRLLIFYLFFAICYVYAMIQDFYIIMNTTKALPMMTLLVYMVLNGYKERLIILAIFFSMIGDILLLKSIDHFIGGLIAFLIAHICYIFVFYKRNPKLNINYSFLYYGIGAYVFYMLFDALGDMMIPVFIYILVITTMTWFAKNQSTQSRRHQLAFFGALLFMLSDTILAFDRFGMSSDFAHYYVIISYWAAQYLIFKSAE
jgi:uncharacterized membrane protein YhhN